MRFVSHSPHFALGIVKKVSHFSNLGDEIVDRPGYTARFTQDDVSDEDLAFAQKTWGVHPPGNTVLTDEVTPTPLQARVSVFDTDEMAIRENWAGQTVTEGDRVWDFKEYVEHKLVERSDRHPDFRQLVERPLEPPWPTYLQWNGSLEQLVQTLVYQGHDLRKVARYERQINRPQVAEAIEAEIARQEAEITGSVQVPA